MTKVKGRDLMLFKKDTNGYKAYGAATDHTMNLSRDELDVSTKDSGEFGDVELGQIKWDIQAENMLILADEESLVDSFLKGEELEIAFAIKNETGGTEKPAGGWTIGEGGYEGKVVITSISVKAPHNGNATCSVTFKGKGPFNKRKAVQ